MDDAEARASREGAIPERTEVSATQCARAPNLPCGKAPAIRLAGLALRVLGARARRSANRACGCGRSLPAALRAKPRGLPVPATSGTGSLRVVSMLGASRCGHRVVGFARGLRSEQQARESRPECAQRGSRAHLRRPSGIEADVQPVPLVAPSDAGALFTRAAPARVAGAADALASHSIAVAGVGAGRCSPVARVATLLIRRAATMAGHAPTARASCAADAAVLRVAPHVPARTRAAS